MPKSMVEAETKDTEMCAGTAAHNHLVVVLGVSCLVFVFFFWSWVFSWTASLVILSMFVWPLLLLCGICRCRVWLLLGRGLLLCGLGVLAFLSSSFFQFHVGCVGALGL